MWERAIVLSADKAVGVDRRHHFVCENVHANDAREKRVTVCRARQFSERRPTRAFVAAPIPHPETTLVRRTRGARSRLRRRPVPSRSRARSHMASVSRRRTACACEDATRTGFDRPREISGRDGGIESTNLTLHRKVLCINSVAPGVHLGLCFPDPIAFARYTGALRPSAPIWPAARARSTTAHAQSFSRAGSCAS